MKVTIFWIGSSQQTKPGYTILIKRPNLCHPFGKKKKKNSAPSPMKAQVQKSEGKHVHFLHGSAQDDLATQGPDGQTVTAAYYSKVRIIFFVWFSLRLMYAYSVVFITDTKLVFPCLNTHYFLSRLNFVRLCFGCFSGTEAFQKKHQHIS